MSTIEQDRNAILDVTAKLGLLVDAREWGALEGLFTDPVEIDYTSLNGGDPATLPPADVVAGWRGVLDNLTATQHLIAGQVIDTTNVADRGEATCAANVQATHVLDNATGGPIWTVGGRYDYRLRRTGEKWLISALKLTVLWAGGNQHIMILAGRP